MDNGEGGLGSATSHSLIGEWCHHFIYPSHVSHDRSEGQRQTGTESGVVNKNFVPTCHR